MGEGEVHSPPYGPCHAPRTTLGTFSSRPRQRLPTKISHQYIVLARRAFMLCSFKSFFDLEPPTPPSPTYQTKLLRRVCGVGEDSQGNMDLEGLKEDLKEDLPRSWWENLMPRSWWENLMPRSWWENLMSCLLRVSLLESSEIYRLRYWLRIVWGIDYVSSEVLITYGKTHWALETLLNYIIMKKKP